MQDIPINGTYPELKLAIEAAVEAGKSIMNIYGREFETRTKSDDSPVTEADLKSNEIIRGFLSNTPHAVLSEEDKDDGKRLVRQTVWIVDPLDGTMDFIDGTGEFTVMIALVRDKKPIVGVINWPAGDTIFAAQYGKGAFRYSDSTWQRIAVTEKTEITECIAVGSRHHPSDMERKIVRGLGIKRLDSFGSSLKIGRICSGQAEIYIAATDKMKEWDSAASYCIINEAGGRMTDMLGHDISYNGRIVHHRDGILATNGHVHDIIVEEFKRLISCP